MLFRLLDANPTQNGATSARHHSAHRRRDPALPEAVARDWAQVDAIKRTAGQISDAAQVHLLSLQEEIWFRPGCERVL